MFGFLVGMLGGLHYRMDGCVDGGAIRPWRSRAQSNVSVTLAVASFFPSTWFSRLAPADAARFVVVLERVRQGNWLLLVRTPSRRVALRLGDQPDELFVFGTPDQDLGAAVRLLHQQMSPLIFRRLRDDRTFGSVLLLEAVRALLDNDVDLTRGLLRRFADTSCGFSQLAEVTEVHPKSLVPYHTFTACGSASG